MIKTDELLYEFELQLNKISREDNRNVPLEDKLLFLNRAQISVIKSFLNRNNVLGVGYESIRKRIDDLQVLKVSDKLLPVTKTTNQRFIGYESSLTGFDYMFYVTSYSVAKHNDCTATISNNLIGEGELETQYYDSHREPSFAWRETLCTIGSDKLYVYTDGTFNISEVRLTYLRTPKKIDKEGYVDFDGNPSTNQDSELPEYLKYDIVDLAVKYAAHATDNQLQDQFATQRIKTNE